MFVYVCCLRNIEPHTVTIRPLKKKKNPDISLVLPTVVMF